MSVYVPSSACNTFAVKTQVHAMYESAQKSPSNRYFCLSTQNTEHWFCREQSVPPTSWGLLKSTQAPFEMSSDHQLIFCSFLRTSTIKINVLLWQKKPENLAERVELKVISRCTDSLSVRVAVFPLGTPMTKQMLLIVPKTQSLS